MHPGLASLPEPGRYVSAWKKVLVTPSTVSFDLGFPRGAVPRDQVLQEFREALDRRINHRGGIRHVGRKHSEIYQTELMRDAYALHDRLTKRVRVYRFACPEVNRRFGHLLARYDD